MALQRVEIGLVSMDEALVDFFADVFELERLPPIGSGAGIVHRVQAPGVAIKVMVPSVPPSPAEPIGSFLGATGLRYLTMYVTDLDGTLERVAARKGQVLHGPMDIGPGVRIAVVHDPDGNTIEVVEGAPQPDSD
ncbi:MULTISPECIES: VOC family protein [unclassified Pseudofrankia]|uniref:VOC family protein n=1 Tax=unclassified Pseudofrankia TaxID=2994372 RepID=UPI0008D94F27|nr:MULTISPECIES: VOC family protein [unclassified Pseudofrankia]MDT3445337.1 VOC family protein [Pseudofrankia sp. BMG5.37]OHV51344.1 glyoxalase [Pseudofrankia sp. BMG5.36]